MKQVVHLVTNLLYRVKYVTSIIIFKIKRMSQISSVCQFSKMQLNTELSYIFVTFPVPALKMECAQSYEILVSTRQNHMVVIKFLILYLRSYH